MKGFWAGFILLVCMSVGLSLIPSWFGRSVVILVPPDQNDVIPLSSPERAQTIYGVLAGYPHMYEFAALHPVHLSLSVRVPDIALARNNMTCIVLRVNDNGSVTEITRMQAKDAEWQKVREPFGGTRYRQGGTFETDLPAGEYRIEISTPDDIGPYAFLVGAQKAKVPGYFGMLRQLADVETFFGVSSYRVLLAPVVVYPLALFLVLSGGIYWLLRRLSGIPDTKNVQ